MANLFPMFVRLDGRKCLVVGAGLVAEQKITGLLSAGADVQVVSPEATSGIRDLASLGHLRWEARTFIPSDMDDVALVITATGNRTVNEVVFRIASARRALCNAVDDPDHCHFHTPALVRRGQLQIAISTGGSSPALAQRLRNELEDQFGSEYTGWLESLRELRKSLLSSNVSQADRRRVLHRVASRESFERFVARSRSRERSA